MSANNDGKWKILEKKVFEQRIDEAFRLFRRNDIEPILIKGWAAALNYTDTFERGYTDIDFAVSASDYERALKLSLTDDTLIDLHRELRHLDTLSWERLFKNSRLINKKFSFRILSAEDHLRVLCVHWLNDGGAYRERLWDIYYAVENRPVDFDWNKCLGVVGDKRKKWVIAAVKLAEKYLGLNIKKTPLAALDFEIPKWVVETVEREWRSRIKLRPLKPAFGFNRHFYEQLKIRMLPNPLQATIETNSEIDDKPRLPIQIKNICVRLRCSAVNSFGKQKMFQKND